MGILERRATTRHRGVHAYAARHYERMLRPQDVDTLLAGSWTGGKRPTKSRSKQAHVAQQETGDAPPPHNESAIHDTGDGSHQKVSRDIGAIADCGYCRFPDSAEPMEISAPARQTNKFRTARANAGELHFTHPTSTPDLMDRGVFLQLSRTSKSL